MIYLPVKVCICLLLACIGFFAAADSFVLVDEGKMIARVESTSNAKIDEDIVFFTNAIAKMSGAIAPAQRVENKIIFDVVKANLFEEDRYEISFPDAATMKIRGTDESCRWAINGLLEEQGVVFCYPGEEGAYWPRRKTIAWEIRRRAAEPSLKLQRQMWAESKEWERCLNGKTYFGNFQNHSMFLIFPKEKYAEAEIFEKIMPFRGGKRVRPPKEKWDMRWQPCFASEESVSEAVKNICKALEGDPRRKVFSLSVNDLEGYCECDGCKALNGGTFDRRTKFGTSKNRDHSPSYYAWANKVAEGVTKKFPNVVFGCLAYCGTIDPPPFDLHPSIVPFLCQDVSKIGDEKEFSQRVELIREWNRRAKALGFWDYGYGCRHYVIPRLYTSLQKKFFDVKDDFACIQSYFCEGSSFMGEGPKRYLYYKLMWNHKLDIEAEIDRWCRACVGDSASQALKEYYAIWENFWKSPILKRTPWYVKGMRGLYFNYDSKDYVFALTREELNRARSLMAKVVSLANITGDANQRARAARLADYHAFYESRIVACGAFRSSYDGTFKSEEEAAGFVRALGEMCRAQKKAEELTERICAYRLKDEPKAKWACDSFRRLNLQRLSVTVLFNSLADYLDSPLVVEATRISSGDSDLSDDMRGVLKGLSNLEKLPDVSWGRAKTPDEDFATWHRARRYGVEVKRGDVEGQLKLVQSQGWSAATKIVMGLKTGGNYLFCATLHNTTSRTLHINQIFASQRDDLPNGEEGGGGGGETQRNYSVAPGESIKMRLFGRISNRYRAARLYIIPSLNQGESVLVDGVSLLDLGSE